MVNGDPTTYMFRVWISITYPEGYKSERAVSIGGSNYQQAVMNAVNCYKRWYPTCKVEAC